MKKLVFNEFIPLQKFYINDILITNIKKNSYLKYIYQANYIISINNDIIDFTNTKKEAIKIAKNFIKELEVKK